MTLATDAQRPNKDYFLLHAHAEIELTKITCKFLLENLVDLKINYCQKRTPKIDPAKQECFFWIEGNFFDRNEVRGLQIWELQVSKRPDNKLLLERAASRLYEQFSVGEIISTKQSRTTIMDVTIKDRKCRSDAIAKRISLYYLVEKNE